MLNVTLWSWLLSISLEDISHLHVQIGHVDCRDLVIEGGLRDAPGESVSLWPKLLSHAR